MPFNSPIPTLAATLQSRCSRLSDRFQFPAVLWSGQSSARNFPANVYSFRASSHFLYFAGMPLERAAIHIEQSRLTLFLDPPPASSALWHGESPTPEAIAAQMGAAAVYPLAELPQWAKGCATIAVQDPITRQHQELCCDRPIPLPPQADGLDLALIQAIIALRLTHDAAALAELQQAAQISVEAHQAAISAIPTAPTEAALRAAIEAVMLAHNATPAYGSIVTTRGEVLHNTHYHHPLQAGDLVLIDAGAETASGWAADITRTWPVSGQFSPTQQAIYDLVLAAHDACIAAIRPGVEYRDIHLLAAQILAAGLVELGILRGDPQSLVERDAHALFFPHGIGHLLGLDVHDMEDLGDLAGYAEGRSRSDRFGLGYLRLDRPLQTGMLVTIEPGFYQVPALLQDPQRRATYHDAVNWERLAAFADVRGIRIEDDVLVTESGAEVLTQGLGT
jgi:Xaa-Pro aminopeptidase